MDRSPPIPKCIRMCDFSCSCYLYSLSLDGTFIHIDFWDLILDSWPIEDLLLGFCLGAQNSDWPPISNSVKKVFVRFDSLLDRVKKVISTICNGCIHFNQSIMKLLLACYLCRHQFYALTVCVVLSFIAGVI